jgi:acyl-CoA thioesterase YciA
MSKRPSTKRPTLVPSGKASRPAKPAPAPAPAKAKSLTPVSPTPRPPSSEPSIRVVMMPRDTNADGTIFGGVLLSLIDQAAYIEAIRQAHHRYVTVSFKEVEFHQPVYVGDVLSIYAETKKIGRTSIAIELRVTAMRRTDPDLVVHVTQAQVVFVAIDDSGRPVAVLD